MKRIVALMKHTTMLMFFEEDDGRAQIRLKTPSSSVQAFEGTLDEALNQAVSFVGSELKGDAAKSFERILKGDPAASSLQEVSP